MSIFLNICQVSFPIVFRGGLGVTKEYAPDMRPIGVGWGGEGCGVWVCKHFMEDIQMGRQVQGAFKSVRGANYPVGAPLHVF